MSYLLHPPLLDETGLAEALRRRDNSRRLGGHGYAFLGQDSFRGADVNGLEAVPNAHGTESASAKARTLDLDRMLDQDMRGRVQNRIQA